MIINIRNILCIYILRIYINYLCVKIKKKIKNQQIKKILQKKKYKKKYVPYVDILRKKI